MKRDLKKVLGGGVLAAAMLLTFMPGTAVAAPTDGDGSAQVIQETKFFTVTYKSDGVVIGTATYQQGTLSQVWLKGVEPAAKAGYVFKGYSYNGTFVGDEENAPLRMDMVLEAVWEADSTSGDGSDQDNMGVDDPVTQYFTVTYKSDGATIGEATFQKGTLSQVWLKTIEPAAKAGYVFKGYSYNGTFVGNEENAPLMKDMVLEAVWEADSTSGDGSDQDNMGVDDPVTQYFTVTYKSDGKIIGEATFQKYTLSQIWLKTIEPAAKAGYVFKGYSYNGTFVGDEKDAPLVKNMVLEAVWEADSTSGDGSDQDNMGVDDPVDTNKTDSKSDTTQSGGASLAQTGIAVSFVVMVAVAAAVTGVILKRRVA
ncbi:3-carboxymuconate cyclase [Bifidobacterium lemurum]|uniref:3-carboxymuconate cyclase n=1 Tax=Bifidobacterium lemurum TaxID=1603886 RepID=A0A261FS44_9BIFI|nr:hypothetical protein [Bifidobacterium lemurum]OZG62002.1 3-carboxymuconate cyclase [Bifidobacterium lemurum]QOL34836.1 hypothetical protein BL8807_02755 [Bifidobacterium lemurum]